MTRALEFKTTVLPGHRIEICTPELPDGIPATVRVTLDDPIATVASESNPDLRAAENRFVRDLPQLLETMPGRWVAYTAEGRLAEGDDELALFRLCYGRGLQRGHFLVARVEPDLPMAEIDENWFPPEA